jgi:type I restriction-modification system DNA methylase subunit
MFVNLIMALESEMTDVLGEIFMELELGSKWKGQFFTPMSVCRATARVTLSDAEKLISEKGFITVHEPSAGGGALIIAMAEALRINKIN